MSRVNSSTIFLVSSFSIPILVIISYTKWVIDNKKNRLEYEDADMAYYIGFMITILLLIATISFTTFKADELPLLLNKFSAGIFSTFIGLGARLYLLRIINTQDTADDTMSDIVKELQNFIGELKFQFAEIADTAKSMADSFKNMTKEIEDVSSTISQSMKDLDFKDTITDLSESFKLSLSSIELAVKEIEKQTVTAKNSTMVSVSTNDKLINSLSGIIRQIDSAKQTFDKFDNYLNTKLLNTIEATGVQMNGLNEAQILYSKNIHDSSSHLNTAKTQLARLNTSLKKNLDLAEREVADQISVLNEINEKIGSLSSGFNGSLDYSSILNDIKAKISTNYDYSKILKDINSSISIQSEYGKSLNTITEKLISIENLMDLINTHNTNNSSSKTLDNEDLKLVNRNLSDIKDTLINSKNYSHQHDAAEFNKHNSLLEQILSKLIEINSSLSPYKESQNLHNPSFIDVARKWFFDRNIFGNHKK